MDPKKLTPEEYKSPSLDKEGTKRIQGIVGSLLYYAREAGNKLRVAISSFGSQQAAATQHMNKTINQLLNYSATYRADGILYLSSDLVLCEHSDAGFHNKIKGLRTKSLDPNRPPPLNT